MSLTASNTNFMFSVSVKIIIKTQLLGKPLIKVKKNKPYDEVLGAAQITERRSISCQKLSKIVKSCQKLSKVVISCHKLSKVVKSCQQLS